MMKKLFLTILTCLCTQAVLAATTPDTVIAAFKKAGIPITKVVVYTEETDPNTAMGRPNQYVAKANWADKRTGSGIPNTVEIFKNKDDLLARKEYVENIGKSMPTLVQYQFAKDYVLIRLDKKLTPKQAADYEKTLNSM